MSKGILWCLFLASAWVAPQACRADLADDAWSAYLSGDFNRVTQLVYSSLTDSTLSTSRKALIYFTLGCSNAMQGRDASAREAFRQALGYDSLLHYNSMELPPPVWKIFEPIQTEYQTKGQGRVQTITPLQSPGRTDTLRLIEPKYHSQATILRALVFPGWGHLNEGDRTGYRFMIGEGLLLAGLTYSLLKTNDARDAYFRSTTPSEIEARYSRYNNYYRLAAGFGIAAAGVYLISQWDLFSRPPTLHLSVGSDGRLEAGFTINM